MRRFLVRLGSGVAGLVVASTTASAHGDVGHSGATIALAVVIGLPIVAGLGGGVAAIRYRGSRKRESADRRASLAVGLLLIGLGAASLLPAVKGHLWLSVAGGTAGAALAIRSASSGTVSGIGNHADLTLGVVSAHRILEGVVLGTLYSAGTAVGVLGAVVLAGHAGLETAAVGGLYATEPRRPRAIGAVVLVQAGYVVGAVVGLGVAGAMPVSIRTLALGVVGGALLVVGANETKGSVVTARSAKSFS